MLRSTAAASRIAIKGIVTAPTIRSSYSIASIKFRRIQVASPRQLTKSRPRILPPLCRTPPPPTAALFYGTKAGLPSNHAQIKHELKQPQEKLTPHPSEISSASSVRHIFERGQASGAQTTTHGGFKSDIETIKETFSLSEVPKESLYIGAAGILPYAATSLSTVYLAFDINYAHEHGTGYIFTPETAHQLLDTVTPIQIGYGAVIISFLGAIHWGMEYSGYGGHQSYRRYMYGVIAPAIAWPTIFMPVEYALITQFFAFNFLYFADARATVRGWFPPWYSIYRFVLTFFVGASIVTSLVGRGRIVKHDAHLKEPADYIKGGKDARWIALEQEEKEKREATVKAKHGAKGKEANEGQEDSDEKEDSKREKETEDDKKDNEL